jgi:hypothetical protein
MSQIIARTISFFAPYGNITVYPDAGKTAEAYPVPMAGPGRSPVMASIETLRPGAPGAETQAATLATQGEAAPAMGAPASGVPASGAAPRPAGLAAFQGAPGADRLTGLVAFALATERQAGSDPETIARLRQEAEVALTDHAFRTLHNNVERLQRDAVMQHLAHLPRPPGLFRLVTANLLALVLAAAGAGWLALHPQTLAGITGLLAG